MDPFGFFFAVQSWSLLKFTIHTERGSTMPATSHTPSSKSDKAASTPSKKTAQRKKAPVTPWAQEVFDKVEALRKAMNGQKLA